ncbi:MAG TPA: PIG-L family deacetylase [Anaerolineales bacterium]|nr:PIG-L family deacetylase [Anaerolineales bacterium]
MRLIYISPHLDDAILSAGGLIHDQVQAGRHVEIWTVFCGFPPANQLSSFAQIIHQKWGIMDTNELVAARRAEDKAAADIVGAQVFHFDFLDCIYRRGRDGDWLYSDVFIPPHTDDDGLPAQIAEAISARLNPDDELVCQLALGAHLDHTLVRRAAELLGRPLTYDVDIPYLFNFPDDFALKTAKMKEITHRITEAGLRLWGDAILAYTSQFGTLFSSPEEMREKLQQYWAEKQGISFWKFE